MTTAIASKLSLDVFVGSENAFYVTSTLISGERDAVLIDAQFTRSDALRLAERIEASGKRLTTVYVTHGHPDHYWGFTTLAERFPDARLVAAPEVAAAIDESQAAKVAQWKPLYGDEVPDSPIAPEALDGDVIELEGNELEIIHIGQGDDRASTVVSVPALATIIAGDVAFNGTHVWLAEADAEERVAWMANLVRLADMDPATVVAGHMTPAARDVGKQVFLDTRDYIAAFDAVAAQAGDARVLIEAMTAMYAHHAVPMILEVAAGAALPAAA